MKSTDESSPLHSALRSALDALPDPDEYLAVGVVPITDDQWKRSITDADPSGRFHEYQVARLKVSAAIGSTGPSVGKVLRPRAIDMVRKADTFCSCMRYLAALDPGDSRGPDTAKALRISIAVDARSVLNAALGLDPLPELPAHQSLPEARSDGQRDVLKETFGHSAAALADEDGRFCDTRVIALYRLKLDALQQMCDPPMSLVCERPPSVFTAVSAVRDMVTSTSPWLTLWGAREIRTRILGSFQENPSHVRNILAEASEESDKESLAFERLFDRLRRSERAMEDPNGTERDKAINLFEAYKHMAEGLTRRWLKVMLSLAGHEDSNSTLGVLGPLATRHLGEIGARVQAALSPAIRNAEAHEDFIFDEDTGMLLAAGAQISPKNILAQLTELDVLQRAFIIGRLAAFADQPALATDRLKNSSRASASSDLFRARMRFGHAGQSVKSFVRNRDRLDIVLDGLQANAPNPCFLALIQAAQILPTVGRFVVRVDGVGGAVIDIPASVLHENFHVLKMAVQNFSDRLPPATFLPSLAWARLACEPVDQAAQAAAWIALNDVQSAILDAEADPAEAARLSHHYLLAAGAITCTLRVLPEGSHLTDLQRSRRVILAALNTFVLGDPFGVLTDRIVGVRDQIADSPPPILPTLDRKPLPKRIYPPEVS
jgi:hypothetical protein